MCIRDRLKTKSVKELIIENLCTLFNLINVVLAFLVLLTGSFKNLTFLFVVFLNTAIGVIQSMRSEPVSYTHLGSTPNSQKPSRTARMTPSKVSKNAISGTAKSLHAAIWL